jgi:tripeptidyl-peptidase-1
MALSPGAPTYFWSVAGRNEYTNRDGYEPFLTWLAEINDSPSAARPLPLVHSVSYGDTLDQIPSNYTQRVDVEFMKLAARGVSVIFSSGDDGASSVEASTPNSTACTTAHAEWPAASPWVTSVGGTQLSTAATPYCNAPDAACTQAGERMCSADRGGVITSGGGFGDAPRPAWQRAHVDRYLQSAELAAEGLSSAYFNAQGRGYPDVAAYASNFPILINGAYANEFGTSASAPVFAAMVTQWNDILLSQGRPPLGFLNPWLYAMAEQYPEAFTDVTVGVNKCTTAGRNCCAHGFPAARGWDAVSGHGSPRFDIISALLRGTYNATVSSSGSGGASTADIQASAKTATTLSAVAVGTSLAAIVFGAWLVKKQRASDAAVERTSTTDASLYSVMQNAD